MPKDKADHENEDGAKSAAEKPTELLDHPSYQELMRKLDEAEQKCNQYWERILRMQADNENAVRRTERDVANAHKYALEKFAVELLPVVDSLELCIASVSSELDSIAEAIVEGVKLTLKLFYNAMEKFGIKQVNPVAEQFNPEYQQAISMEYDPAAKPGTVISVLQKGYVLNGRLLRPALVIVAKAAE